MDDIKKEDCLPPNSKTLNRLVDNLSEDVTVKEAEEFLKFVAETWSKEGYPRRANFLDVLSMLLEEQYTRSYISSYAVRLVTHSVDRTQYNEVERLERESAESLGAPMEWVTGKYDGTEFNRYNFKLFFREYLNRQGNPFHYKIEFE